ncbi:MAG: class I SAM-dependent DNA methyltransferase, partial [Actinomycetales bacterium]|nr:class I SAM-dependent DNA methyltransferase [Actinomycetales bacterium]
VFRLAGRERQQSASYYTPEVLTRFTVSQALEELLDQDGVTTPAEDLLHLSVCEPALGSGAFAIEAVRQLAEQYLRRRQEETGQRIDPDSYPRELQRVKAYLALHQVYGVDLNATAVELAEISLWLDTMVSGLQAPWFGLHLRRGNSLIGARHAAYSQAQVANKSWLTATPTDHPLTELAADMAAGVRTSTAGAIHHFLLPAAGWGSAVEAKEARTLAPDETAALKSWRRQVTSKPTKAQLTALLEVADRVEVLWQFALRRLQIAESEARRDIPVWGHEPEPSGGNVTRERIEESLADANGAYRRLRRVMDAWAALWFWPLTETDTHPPTFAQWLDALQQLLGRDTTQAKAHGKRSYEGMDQLSTHLDWDELNDAERMDLGFADAKPVATVLDAHPWLRVCEEVADQQGFFHWELDFATVFARGGFDLQLGNPPWVRPRSDVDALLAEGDPWWQLANKPSEAARAAKRVETLELPGLRDMVLDGTAEVAVTAEYANDATNYPYLSGLQPDLYRCFMSQTWRHLSPHGTVGLIHPETHFTDEKAGGFRAVTYPRLRRHWQFINELVLFEIHDQLRYGIHIYGNELEAVAFVMASSVYHPDTVERSFRHDGSGNQPGFKDLEGNWDLRPHAGRIIEALHNPGCSWGLNPPASRSARAM